MGINPRNLQIRPGHGLVAGFFATSFSIASIFFGGIITTTAADNYAGFFPSNHKVQLVGFSHLTIFFLLEFQSIAILWNETE